MEAITSDVTSLNALNKSRPASSMWWIFSPRPGALSGGQTGLQDGDPQHLHQARGPPAGGPQVRLPRGTWGRGPCLQVSQNTFEVNLFLKNVFSVLFPKTWSEFVTCIKKYTSDCLTADQVSDESLLIGLKIHQMAIKCTKKCGKI